MSVSKHVPQSLLLRGGHPGLGGHGVGTGAWHGGWSLSPSLASGGCAWGVSVGNWAWRPRAGWQGHSAASPGPVWCGFVRSPPELDAFPKWSLQVRMAPQNKPEPWTGLWLFRFFAWGTSVPWSPWAPRGAPTWPRGCVGTREGGKQGQFSTERTGCVFSPTSTHFCLAEISLHRALWLRCSLSIPALISLGGEAEAFIIFKRHVRLRLVDGPRQGAVLSSVETAEVSSVRHLCRVSPPPPQHFLRACLAGSQGGAVCAFPTEVLPTINVGKIQAFKKRDRLDDLSHVSVCVCVCVLVGVSVPWEDASQSGWG